MSTTPIQLPALEPPKYYSPFDARAKLMNLQNLAQQQQIGQQSLEEGKLKLAEQQRLVGEGQKIRDVLQNSPDLRSALPNIYKINPVLGTSMMKSLHDQEKSELDMETARIGQSAAKAKRLASLAGSATDEDSYHRAINTAVDEKLMSVQEAHEHLSKGWGPQSQAEMQQAVQMGLSAKEQADQRLAQLKENREALDAKHKQELAGVNTLQKQIEITVQTMPPVDPQTGSVDPQEWAKWRAEAPPAVQAKIPPAPSPVAIALMKRMGLTPDQQRQAEQAKATLEEQKVRDAQTASHEGVLESQGQARLGIERQNAARMQKQFDATYGAMLGPNGEQLSPEAMKAMAMQDPAAVGVANYQLPPPNAGRGGPGAATLRKVMAINPSYNAQNWQSQAAMMKGYTSGSQSKEISGINTALGHVAALGEAIDALKNTDVQALNRIANYFGVQTGNDAVTTFKAIVHKVAPEINRAYVGGVGSQGEIQSQESDFDPKLGDKQLRSNVGITAKLLRSKIGSLENQWKQTMGSDFNARFMMPEAQRAIEKWAPEGGGAPSGGRSGAATPSLPATLSQSDVGKVYTSPRTGKRIKITAVNPQNPKQFQSQEVP